MENMDIQFDLKCPLQSCGKHFNNSVDTIKHLKYHIRCGHHVMCPFTPCGRIYHILSSFTSHISRYHSYYRSSQGLESDNIPNDSFGHSSTQMDVIEVDEKDLASSKIPESIPHTEEVEKVIGLICLSLQYKHLIPASTVDNIFSCLKDLCEVLQRPLKNSIRTALENYLDGNIVETVLSEICGKNAIFNIADIFKNGNLRSIYMRDIYFKKNMKYIAPVSYVISQNSTSPNEFASFQYVPVLSSIKALLSNEDVAVDVLNPPVTCPDVLKDVVDGEACRHNVLCQSNDIILKLILYQDAFEVVNPLGSGRCKHKISKSESKNLKTELPKSTGVVTLIAYYFGEDLNQIFKYFQKETTFPQILEDFPKSPFIACIGNTVATAETFYVIAEREVVCSCRSFFEAVAFQFASFYVFNIEYPNKALLTFDFIQRFFGDINPSGTKSKKSKGKDVNAKVIGLARRVNLSQALYVPLLEIDV
ncbi:uncharacterized protein LOC144419906 [Styela clava]